MSTNFFKSSIMHTVALGICMLVAYQCDAKTFKDLKVRNCLQAGSLNVCRNLRVNGTILGPNGSPIPAFDVDNGANVVPFDNIVQVSGLSGTGFVPSGLETHNGGTNDIFIENRRWLTEYVVDASAQVGERGTFQTIQGAMDAAAAAGGNVYIAVRPGTYTEDLTFRANIHLAGASTDGRVPLVTVVGNHTYSEEGPVVIEDMAFNAISGVLFTITPTTGLSLFVQKFCGNTNAIPASAGSLALIDGGGTAFAVYAQFMCQSQVDGTGVVVVDQALSILNGTTFNNNSAVPLFRMTGAGQASVDGSSSLNSLGDVFSVESATANVQIQNSFVTAQTGFFVNFTTSPGGTVVATHVTVNTTDLSGNNVTGAGTYQYADIVSIASNGISLATTAVALDWKPYATAGTNINPGGPVRGTAAFDDTQFSVTDGFVNLISPFFAYTNVAATPYVVSEIDDSYLSVDTSTLAITVQLPDAPTTGRTFTIKDRTGNAGAPTNNNIIVTTVSGTVTIDGPSTSYTISTNYGSVQLIFNGAGYEIYSTYP